MKYYVTSTLALRVIFPWENLCFTLFQVSLSEYEFLQWIDDYLTKDDSGNPEDVDQDMIAAFRVSLQDSRFHTDLAFLKPSASNE